MKGEFKRLLLREFGRTNYRCFVSQILSDKSKDEILSLPVIKQMMNLLLLRSSNELDLMETRLNEAMLVSYKICKGFLPFFFCSLLSAVIVQAVSNSLEISLICTFLISLCLLARLVQFLINKFCYIDARLILTYKVSLDIARKINKRDVSK